MPRFARVAETTLGDDMLTEFVKAPSPPLGAERAG
jgi:hypothetical protein